MNISDKTDIITVTYTKVGGILPGKRRRRYAKLVEVSMGACARATMKGAAWI